MFSYLRPHRRTPSTPSSPVPDQQSSFEGPLQLNQDISQQPPRLHDGHAPKPRTPQLTAQPPLLPPIARVTSAGSDLAREYSREDGRRSIPAVSSQSQRYTAWENTSLRDPTSVVPARPGSNLEQRSISSDATADSGDALGRIHQVSNVRPELDIRAPSYASAPGAMPTDHSKASFSRTSIGTRLPTPPPMPEHAYSRFEAPSHRSSKTRLNLLNPMSLLARRRTSQQALQLPPISTGPGESSTTTTYDPRIRGTRVHDFSAPRPRQNVMVDTASLQAGASRYDGGFGVGDLAHRAGGHTPVFKEDFEDEQYPAAGPNVRRANDLTDLTLPKLPFAKGTQKQVEHREPETGLLTQNSSQDVVEPTTDSVPDSKAAAVNKGLGTEQPPSASDEHQETRSPPKSSASKRSTRTRNVSEVSAKDLAILGLPKHMKSTSSRFSFDMIGAAKQEKLLEERHRQRALEKKTGESEFDDEDAFDDFDYDPSNDEFGYEEPVPEVGFDYEEPVPEVNIDEGDDYEEPIPGVNVDHDESVLGGIDNESSSEDLQLKQNSSTGFNFYQHPHSNVNAPLSPYSPELVTTPRDANGEVIGFALTKNSPLFNTWQTELHENEEQLLAQTIAKSQGDQGSIKPHPSQLSSMQGTVPAMHQQNPAEDEMFFDDGAIEAPDEDDAAPFDESLFDLDDTDQYGRPLRPYTLSVKQQQTLYTPPTISMDNESRSKDKSSKLNATDDIVQIASEAGVHTTADAQPHGQDLTFNSLAAYQSALAAAAHSAAASGKFRRDSISSNQDDQDDGHPNLVSDSGHPSSDFSRLEPFSPVNFVDDDFDYDDAFDDDLIIAEANAEALANDWDGFYGQEFGFYSAPAASGETEYANGGYFDPRGIDRMARSHSGRHVHREPNLTPITERSEYSNRNSIMSLSLHGASLNSPGLSQLAGMLNEDSEGNIGGDMTLSALLKLRRGAWGGSQASLHSSNGSPLEETSSSPIGRVPSWGFAGGFGHVRKNSSLSMHSDPAAGSDNQSNRPESPMLTMGNRVVNRSGAQPLGISNVSHPRSSFSPELQPQPPAVMEQLGKLDEVSVIETSEIIESNNTSTNQRPPTPAGQGQSQTVDYRHRRTSSSDSVSYTKEADPAGKQRWVLERRRTSDDGGVEVLGREVVTSGRI